MLSPLDLCAYSGEKIKILQPGFLNQHSGPDFSNAKLEINGTLWVGNVEIHVKSSDWIKHGHSRDVSYKKIILHVVFENDVELNLDIPTLEIGRYFTSDELSSIAGKIISDVLKKDAIRIGVITNSSQEDMEHTTAIRLKKRSAEIEQYLKETKNDWEEVFYLLLARNFGFHNNSFPFEWLARSLPLSCIRPHRANLSDVESMIFGQSGLLLKNSNQSVYERDLNFRYERFRRKYHLTPLAPAIWKFMRLRPSNFPTVRMAQLAAILVKNRVSMVSKILDISREIDAKELFHVEASDYWINHYNFGKESKPILKKLGTDSINNLIINTIIPFQYTFFKKHGENNYAGKALSILNGISPESNLYISFWKSSGLEVKNAMISQALLEIENWGNFKND